MSNDYPVETNDTALKVALVTPRQRKHPLGAVQNFEWSELKPRY